MRHPNSTLLLEAARQYAARGWVPIPLGIPTGCKKRNGKVPITADGLNLRWRRLTPASGLQAVEDAVAAGVAIGVGLALGIGDPLALVDIDLDCAEAREPQALSLLPASAEYGRSSAGPTHRLYLVHDPGETTQLTDPNLEKQEGKKRATVVELRSTGAQSMAPGSWHVVGSEPVEWIPACDSIPELTTTTWPVLYLAVHRIHQYVLRRRAGDTPKQALAWAQLWTPPADEVAPAPKTTPQAKSQPRTRASTLRRLPVRQEGTQAQIETMYRGCPLLAFMRAWQEAGRGWSRELWRLFAGVLIQFGEAGLKEINRLDRAAGYPGDVDPAIYHAAGTSCAKLAAELIKELRANNQGIPDFASSCGTPNNRCGFRTGKTLPSPVRHAAHLEVIEDEDMQEPAKAIDALRARLIAGLQPGDAILSPAGCGTGKSVTLRQCAAASNDKIAIITQTHEQAIEHEQELVKLGVPVVRIPKLRDECVWPAARSILGRQPQDQPSPAGICHDCPKTEQCRYARALRDAPAARVIIMTGARMASAKGWGLLPGRTIVIEESPADVLVPREAWTLAELNALACSIDPAIRWATKRQSRAWLIRLKRLVRHIHRLLRRSSVLTSVKAEQIKKHAVSYPTPFLQDQLARGKVPRIEKLLTWSSWVLHADDDSPAALIDQAEGVITLSWRVSLPQDAPVLVLDATGTREVYQGLLGRTVEVVGGPTTPLMRIERYHDVDCSGSALEKPEHLARTTGVVQAIAGRHHDQRIGLITFKNLVDHHWGVPLHGKGHFGAARGVNRLRLDQPIQVGIVVGPFRPPAHVVRAFAHFVLGATVREISVGGTIQQVSQGEQSCRTWGWVLGTPMGAASDFLTRAELVQAAGRFARALVVYVLADVPLRLGEKVLAAAHVLGIDLPPQVEGGRPREKLDPLVEAVRAYQQQHGHPPKSPSQVIDAARQLGWKARSERTARNHWAEVLAAVGDCAVEPSTPPDKCPPSDSDNFWVL